jgi:UDPglucose 6-dehydrogenase
MKKVAVIGHGYVGRQMARMLSRAHAVIACDPRVTPDEPHPQGYLMTNDRSFAQGASLAVVCVPTPMAVDGSCDTSIVEEVCGWVDAPLVCIKSTVPPGFTESLNERDLSRPQYMVHGRFHFSPEYAGEPVNYVPPQYPDPRNSISHDFCIVGGPQAGKVLDFFSACMATSARYVATSSTAAELAKYMENAYFATKIMFCTEFAVMAESVGVDYKELRNLWLLDSRVDPDHTMVFPDMRGFGGKCLPKDLSAIVHWSQKNSHDPIMLGAVHTMNTVLRHEDEVMVMEIEAEAAE